jgi:transposase
MVVWFAIVFMGQAEARKLSSQSELEKQRLRAGALFEEELGPTEVAGRLGVSVSSANRWKRRRREGGMESLRCQGPRGRRSRLSEEQLARLGQELLRGPHAHGYATDLWTCPRVGAVIRRLFGIEYSDCHVWKLLRKMGWMRQPQGHFVIVHGDVVISRMAARGR